MSGPDVSATQSVADENLRLLRENKRLRQQLAAVESSRWWRLHPRLLLRLVTGSQKGVGALRSSAPSMGSEDVARPQDPLAARFAAEVISKGSFSRDTVSGNSAAWEPILAELEGSPVRVLEIGSFEGLSACFFLWRLPQARVTCIDTFGGSVEDVAFGGSLDDLEARFDANVALVDAARVRKIRGESARVLHELIDEGEDFDLVYVDGSHAALDVLVDAALSWRLTRPRGVVIFDDYTWRARGEDPIQRPGPAIDSFRHVVEEHAEVVFKGRQLALRKTE